MKEQMIVRVTGGLGNQMFQYALGYVLSKKYPQREVKIDATWYRQMEVHNGFELQRIFEHEGHALSLKLASDAEIRRACKSVLAPGIKKGFFSGLNPLREKMEWHVQDYKRKKEKSSVYDENRSKKEKNVGQIKHDLNQLGDRIQYIRGYWQDVNYFEGYMEEIAKEFQFPKPDEKNEEILNKIDSTNAVSVHVRRGDYVGSDFDVLTDDYYKNAIDYVKGFMKNPVFYFFSDDKEYIEKEFAWLKEKELIAHNVGAQSFRDMQLMSRCKVNIIANSSFSKWGALLNTYPDKLVIYPKVYHKDFGQETIELANWVQM